MTLLQFLQALQTHEGSIPLDLPVALIVGGIAYPVDDVWFEPGQGDKGALCIGEDLR